MHRLLWKYCFFPTSKSLLSTQIYMRLATTLFQSKFFGKCESRSRKNFIQMDNFFEKISPGEFLWHVRWAQLHITCLTHQSDNPIPLMGFTG